MQDPKIIEELRRIETENGRLLPQSVVDAARKETSPLHPHFEWDDSAAAEKYRVDQARALIRVCVEYVGTGTDKRRIQAFVSLTSDRSEGGGYRSMTRVIAMDHLRAQLLEDALIDMNRFKAKYASINELATAIHEMDLALKALASPAATKGKRSA